MGIEYEDPQDYAVCRNCDGTHRVEGGLCEACFESMPMDVWITPGRWEPARSEGQAAPR